MSALDRLRDELADVDLGAQVAGWQAWLVDRVGASTQERYLAQIRTLIPDGEP